MMGKIEMRPPPGGRPRDGRHCDLCGCSQPAVRCDKCGCQIFCLSCDDMYHRHPKRRFHLRKAVDPAPSAAQARPVLPMKVSHLNTTNPGDPSKMPLPPPRKKKSLFGSFRRQSPSSDNSPPLPKKEYSWSGRLGGIKKFMSNRPLPPLPTAEDDNMDQQPTTNGQSPLRGDLSFIHKRSEERPPQLPQRSPRSPEFPGVPQDNRIPGAPGQLRNGTLDPNSSHMNQSHEFPNNEENQWNNRMMNNQNQNGLQPFSTLHMQNQGGFVPHGMPGYPSTMHHSSSATDLHNISSVEGMPNSAPVPPHYPHYPINPHMPPHYPYPMYPQYPNYPQYFGNSFANLSNPPTTDGDFSDQSETSTRHSKKYPFRKRAKRSQSVMMDRMQYPGQFYPFGPFPGYGPWGAPMPMEAPPSPAGSVRSLNRTGRSRRRKKMTSEDDDEISMSSSPMSRPKSSSSDRPPKDPPRAPLATQTTSSEDESEEEEDNRRKIINTIQRKFSDPKRTSSPAADFKMSPKLKKRSSSKQSDSETQQVTRTQSERRASKDSNADQSSRAQASQSSAPPGTWECKHCTFINPVGNRICQVCCKTVTPRTQTPVMATSRSSSAAESSRKPSIEECSSPEKAEETEENSVKKDKRDMDVLNSALDEAEKEISRGLEELMKLKEDMDNNATKETSTESANNEKADTDTAETSKPIYKSTGKMRTSILDKLNINRPQSSKATSSATTETQTGQNNWAAEKIIQARRHSNSSTTSENFNSPLAQSPELEKKSFNKEKRDSSCQTQQDSLIEYLERKKIAEEAFLGRPVNNFGFGFSDRMDMMTSPVPSMYDRYMGGGFGMMQRSHSRASLFTGRLNEPGPFDYGNPAFGYGGAPMYRSVSRSSLTGDYPEGRLSEFQNLRKPDYYLSMEELVERRRQETMRAQGLELVRMIREAEQQGFTAEDIQVALTHCGKQSPMEWLQENWRNMVDSVVTLSTNYGNDKKENDIGLLSENEARDALRLHKGNIWAAVTECVESRQRKYLELSARGKFSRKDIVEALNSSEGDVEMAYAKLSKSTGKPFLMRIWGAGEGAQNEDGAQPLPDYLKDATLRYHKEDIANSDYLSDDLWSEDGAVDWEEDDDYEEEKDLHTCHEDLHASPENIKTPESDKSDYCDAFPVEDRNMSSPSDDIFFVIPETKQEKKKGFLSKLVALRKDSKELVNTPKSSQPDTLSMKNLQLKEDTVSQNSSTGSEQTKNNGAFSAIKSTLSAIKDSVTGGAKSEKKAPCAQPERRTIIVRGQLDHESLSPDSNVKLTSIKSLKEDNSLKENYNNQHKQTEDSNRLMKSEKDDLNIKNNERSESILDDETTNKNESKSNRNNTDYLTSDQEMKIKIESKKPQSLAERLKFAKQSSPIKSNSKSSISQSNSIFSESPNIENYNTPSSSKNITQNQYLLENFEGKEKAMEMSVTNDTNSEVISSKKKPETEKPLKQVSFNLNKKSQQELKSADLNSTNETKINESTATGPSTMSQNETKFILTTEAKLSAAKNSSENQISNDASLIAKVKDTEVASNAKQVISRTTQIHSTKPISQLEEKQQNSLNKQAMENLGKTLTALSTESVETNTVSNIGTSKNGAARITNDKKQSELEVTNYSPKDSSSSNISNEDLKINIESSSSEVNENIISDYKKNVHESITSHTVTRDTLKDNDKKIQENDKKVSEAIAIQHKPLVQATETLTADKSNFLDMHSNKHVNIQSKTLQMVSNEDKYLQKDPVNIKDDDIQTRKSTSESFHEITPKEDVSSVRNTHTNKSEIKHDKDSGITFIDQETDELDQTRVIEVDNRAEDNDILLHENQNDIKSISKNVSQKSNINSSNNNTISNFTDTNSKSEKLQQTISENAYELTKQENSKKQSELKENLKTLKTLPGKSSSDSTLLAENALLQNTHVILQENTSENNIPETKVTEMHNVHAETSEKKLSSPIQDLTDTNPEKSEIIASDKSSTQDENAAASTTSNDSQSASVLESTKSGKLKSTIKSGKVIKKSKSQSKIVKELQTSDNNKANEKDKSELKSIETSENESMSLLDAHKEDIKEVDTTSSKSEVPSFSKVSVESIKHKADIDKIVLDVTEETEMKIQPAQTEVGQSMQGNSSGHKDDSEAGQRPKNILPELVQNANVSAECSSDTDETKEVTTEIGFNSNEKNNEILEIQEMPNTSNSLSSGSSAKNAPTPASATDQKKKETVNIITSENRIKSNEKSNSEPKSTVEVIENISENESTVVTETTESDSSVANDSNHQSETASSTAISQNNEQHSKVHTAFTNIPGSSNKISSPANNVPRPPSTSEEKTNSETNSTYQTDSEDSDYSEESRPSSITPPSPVDLLRSRFEGLAGVTSIRGSVRPQSPFRRMSFNSRKQVIALERKRDATEKPRLQPKPVNEPIKISIPKRSIKQQLEIERKVRKMVADRKCRTYKKAEIVVQLMDMNFEEEEAIQAANECSTLEQAISYLQQECVLCAGHFPVSQIVSMTHCEHRACRECIRAYFTVQIRDRTILDLLCPFCNEPDVGDEDIASDYFNHLDIMLKKLVDVEIHELFQRKLRDRVLMKDPNFRWCSQCSSGFIAMPNLKRLVCPDCNAVTCASCRRVWEREHQGISCEAFAALKDASDPEAQAAGLAKMLTEDGIDCPSCHFKYALAKGGCMHFRCIQCQHDFCSGCSRPFKMGQKCGVSEFCGKLGLHAHHPRNCLFYLRDKEPEDLQKLLDMSGIKYNRDPPNGMEVKSSCQVMEQKETTDGMVDDCCGKEVQDGYAGLCRLHYVEYLGQLVNKYTVDPIQIFDNDDLELVLRRANIRLPPKRYRESDVQYREKLVKLIQDELPLDKMDGS